jgi:hypothetical protein
VQYPDLARGLVRRSKTFVAPMYFLAIFGMNVTRELRISACVSLHREPTVLRLGFRFPVIASRLEPSYVTI